MSVLKILPINLTEIYNKKNIVERLIKDVWKYKTGIEVACLRVGMACVGKDKREVNMVLLCTNEVINLVDLTCIFENMKEI